MLSFQRRSLKLPMWFLYNGKPFCPLWHLHICVPATFDVAWITENVPISFVPFALRLADSNGTRSRADSTEGVDKLTQGLISRPHRRFSIDQLGLEGLPREGCLNRPLHRSLKRQSSFRKLCKTALTCTVYGPSLLQYTGIEYGHAFVDLRTRSACQHQRLKIKLVDHGRGQMSQPRVALARNLPGQRCWARPQAQSKKMSKPQKRTQKHPASSAALQSC